MSHAPRWPGWTVPVVLIAVILVSLVASVAIGLAAAALGADEVTPGLTLAIAVATLAVTWLVLRFVAARAGVDLRPAGLGLRRAAPRMALVVLGFGLAVALVAGGLTVALTDVDLAHPEELGGETTVVGADLATAATVLARAVITAIVVEILLRGYLLAALLPHAGRTVAVIVAGALSAAVVPLEVAPVAVAVGIALCVMYLESGSILPGVGLAAAVNGFVLGVSFDWTVPESAALGLVSGVVAYLLVLGPTRSWDPGPARS